jgi:hypothetical protein
MDDVTIPSRTMFDATIGFYRHRGCESVSIWSLLSIPKCPYGFIRASLGCLDSCSVLWALSGCMSINRKTTPPGWKGSYRNQDEPESNG